MADAIPKLHSCTHQNGFKIARQGGLHATGSYRTGGRSSLCLSGEYRADIGTTILVASIRDDGQTFHESLTPVNSTSDSNSLWTLVLVTKVTNHLDLQRPQNSAFCRSGEEDVILQRGEDGEDEEGHVDVTQKMVTRVRISHDYKLPQRLKTYSIQQTQVCLLIPTT